MGKNSSGYVEHDPVNHPKHYTSHPSGIECIEVMRHMMCNPANAIKYIWRAGLKESEDPIQDLKKAIWYLNDEIKRLEEEKNDTLCNGNNSDSRAIDQK